MKKRLFSLALVALVALLAAGAAGAQPAATRVLFIGNSITYWNDLPAWIGQLSESLGEVVPLKIESKIAPDAYLRHQLEFAEFAWSPVGMIRHGGWHVVVLQAHPYEPLERPEEFLSGAVQLTEEVRSAGAEPLLFQTYPPAEGGYIYEYEEWSGGSPLEMQVRLSEAYALAAERTRTRLVPIGEAWRWVQERYPAIDLYAEDLLHPSAFGSYLIACVLAAAITAKDVRTASWAPPEVTGAEAAALREAAMRVSRE